MAKALAYIIEDQASLAMLYEDSLRLIGYDVVRISNGLEAINYIELHDVPTMIILDVNLPGASGRDVWQHIRKQRRFSETPVVIATANTLMAARLEQEIGAFDQLLIKPLSLKTLQEVAKKWKNQAAQKAAEAAATTAPPANPEPVVTTTTQQTPAPTTPQPTADDLVETQPVAAADGSKAESSTAQHAAPLPLIEDAEDDLTTSPSKPIDPEQDSQASIG